MSGGSSSGVGGMISCASAPWSSSGWPMLGARRCRPKSPMALRNARPLLACRARSDGSARARDAECSGDATSEHREETVSCDECKNETHVSSGCSSFLARLTLPDDHETSPPSAGKAPCSARRRVHLGVHRGDRRHIGNLRSVVRVVRRSLRRRHRLRDGPPRPPRERDARARVRRRAPLSPRENSLGVRERERRERRGRPGRGSVRRAPGFASGVWVRLRRSFSGGGASSRRDCLPPGERDAAEHAPPRDGPRGARGPIPRGGRVSFSSSRAPLATATAATATLSRRLERVSRF